MLVSIILLNARKDKIPVYESMINCEFSGEHASEPTHELKLWLKLDFHEMTVDFLI
jgi:hypothetical protein